MSPIKLSTTAQAALASAATTVDQFVTLPKHLPIAARNAVVKSMLTAGLVEELPSAADQPAWRTNEQGERLGLRATQAGLAAVGVAVDPYKTELSNASAAGDSGPGEAAGCSILPTGCATATRAPLSPRARLCAAAEAVLAAWENDTTEGRPALPSTLVALRAALATVRQSRPAEALCAPRTNTKQASVLTLLRRPEGATVVQVAEATGWAQHTVRGFFAGLKKKGITVTVLKRVRQVGSGKQGAKGSYSVYRVEGVV